MTTTIIDLDSASLSFPAPKGGAGNREARELAESFPGRDAQGSAGKQESTAPMILISSRENARVPSVLGAARLAAIATSSGWTARQTHALAEVPSRLYASGELRKAAYRLATVAVRLGRAPEVGWALWRSEADGPWKFATAYVGIRRYGLRAMIERVKE